MNILITEAGREIVMVSFAVVMVSSLVRKAVIDKEKLQETKKRLKEHQKVLKEATKSGDTKRARKAQEELTKSMMENMKIGMKPMMFTFIPFILIFSWLRGHYSDVGHVVSLFGYELGWLGWYIMCSMITSIILNKLLGIT